MPAPISLLVLQDELVSLLKSALADMSPAVHILTPDDIAGEAAEATAAAKPPTPAVNVVYMGHKPSINADRQRSDGKAALVAQLYCLEVVTRNVRSVKAGSAARSESGVLAMRVLTAVMGARLPSAAGPVLFVPGPGPVYRNGTQYLPLMVQADLLLTR